VELVVLYSEGGKFLVGDLDAFRVAAGVEFGVHGESLAGGGGADQVDRDLVAGQRLTSPVRRDLAEQAMLDLVPFAALLTLFPQDQRVFPGIWVRVHMAR
jgi:hypothetical protein